MAQGSRPASAPPAWRPPATNRGEALTPDPMCLCRFTRHVARLHRVPPYGRDPLGWLDAALDVYRSGRFDVLLPTQEQVAVLSWAKDRLDAAGVATVVPPFEALKRGAGQDLSLGHLGPTGPPSTAVGYRHRGGGTGSRLLVKDLDRHRFGRRAQGGQPERTRTGGHREGRVLVQAAVTGPLP